jgi:hypothetical protein
MAAYAGALAEAPRGTVNAMVVGYLAAFRNLAAASQLQYRRIFEGLRREHGNRA